MFVQIELGFLASQFSGAFTFARYLPAYLMAHQFSSGVFCYNKPAWHKLGLVVDGTLPARVAFSLAKADFQVAGRAVYDQDLRTIPGYQAITRLDTGRTLSVMTSSYTPIQNESLIQIAEALHEDINLDAVCVLEEGKRVTFTARIIGAEGDVVPGDSVRQYLIGCTSHDGSIPFQLLFSPIRVVCQNTLSAALGLANRQHHRDDSIRIRHTRNAASLIEKLPELIDLKRKRFIGGLDELKHMAHTPCNLLQFRNYISNVFADQLQGTVNESRGDKNTARPKVLEDLPAWSNLLLKYEGSAIGSDLPASRGTVWSAYQAVTEYISHDSGRTKDPVEAARKRFESMYFGQNVDTLNKAHQVALAI